MRDISQQFGLNYLIRKSPSYTLAEIRELAQRYTREFQCSVDDELGTFLELSRFLAWLQRREKISGDNS